MEVIKKSLSRFKVAPNLIDYEKARHNFLWKNYYSELSWFGRGAINAAYNAVDRHLTTWRKNKVALYWEGEDGNEKKFTFEDLAEKSSQFGNFLRKIGVKHGDRVFIFLPRIPELYIAFLGVLKVGAIAGTLFSAFREQALYDRLDNSGARVLITNKELKTRIDKKRKRLKALKTILVIDNPQFQRELAKFPQETQIARMSPRDSAFMLYTSGTTGKPKGVVHQHLAILQEHLTAKWVLDLHDQDTYWCTADPGWVTGIAYEILGSWSNGVAAVVYEGRFDPAKWYEILQKYRVSVWYTAPTAIRMLMAAGDKLPKKYDLSHLRHLCSVGEPLNPEAIRWGIKVFGLPFHDNWWQTETGAICIGNFPCLDIKLGSMGKPVPGVEAGIVEGNLALRPGWPSMMIKIWRRPGKYKSYFENGWYVTGDLAYKDKDGYFWFVVRADDVIKTAGERVGPFEVESSLVEHPAVVEAGVIGKPDLIRGEIIKAFVVLKKMVKGTEKLKQELMDYVKSHLAGHAYPREIEFIDKLPKT
ncbi:acetate--CoA ligase, partial [Candidatus Gottesmanbacteria bacterium]|nr:acetate--CoA ligase [Candidatus Gottesmanbacteria bacterium]